MEKVLDFGSARKIGRFLYRISEDASTVAIAYRSLISSHISREMVEAQVSNTLQIASPKKVNIEYDGYSYPGILFHYTISEDGLMSILSQRIF